MELERRETSREDSKREGEKGDCKREGGKEGGEGGRERRICEEGLGKQERCERVCELVNG